MTLARWRIALLLAGLVALGVVVRTDGFYARGHRDGEAFPIESAQRFRYIRMVASGEAIPAVDRNLQWPEGLETRRDTLWQEYLFGWAYRLFAGAELPLSTFVRYLLRFTYVLTLVPLFLITSHISGSRRLGLLAGLIFSVAYPAVERSLGEMIYREHLTFVWLGFHVWFLLRALRESGREERHQWQEDVFAFASGGFLLLALIGWKVNRYYVLALVGFFFLSLLFSRRPERSLRPLALMTAIVAAGAWLIPSHLRADQFLLSPGMLVAYGLCAAYGLRVAFRLPRWSLVIVVVVVVGLVLAIRPSSADYGHVSATIFAKLRYWSKPDDPALLPFEARHYWVPPYVSPNSFRLIHDFGLLLVLAFLPLWATARRLLRREARSDEAFLFLGFVAFFAAYLLFFKLMTFAILFLTPFVALSLPAAMRHGRRAVAICAIGLAAILALHFEQASAGDRSLVGRALTAAHLRPAFIPRAVGSRAPGQLLRWIREETPPDAVFLAEFALSPALLTYTGRSVNLNCFFEGPNRQKFRSFSFHLFGTEDDLYRFARTNESDYFIYSGHMLLRRDSNLSYRYITDHMDLRQNWVIYAMHYRPETLQHFELAYQNPFYRVFRVLEEGERPRQRSFPYSPLYDEQILDRLVFENTEGVSQGEALLYTLVESYDTLWKWKRDLAQGILREEMRELLRPGTIFRWIPEAEPVREEYRRQSAGQEARASPSWMRRSDPDFPRLVLFREPTSREGVPTFGLSSHRSLRSARHRDGA